MTLPLCVAHRGFSARYLENTLTAHEAAIRAGAEVLETDARLNAEGEIFCVHDPDLQRLAGRPVAIAEASSAALRAVELPGGERLMTLADLAKRVAGRVQILVDVKTPGPTMVGALLEVAADTGRPETFRFGFRELEQLRLARKRAPDLRCVALLADYDEAEAWLAEGAAALRIWEGEFDAALEARLAPRAPLWITVGGRGTPDKTGDIDAPRLAALLEREVAAVLLNDPTALHGPQRRAAE